MFVGTLCVALGAFGLSACDDSSSKPPASAGGGNGNPINNLAESPQSLLGKSAGRAREVASQAANQQAAELGLAQEISGESSVVTVAGLEWRPPSAWQQRKPSNSFRSAELLVAGDSGSGETLVVFSSGIGGDVASNIERWRAQVLDDQGQPAAADLKKHTISGVKVTTVAMQGTLQGGTMGGPAADVPNTGFRGAIVEGPGGVVFIKMTGPASVIKNADSAWNTMITGMRKQ